MTNSEIKISMRRWYKYYLQSGNKTYFKIMDSLRTLRAAFLISEKQWKMICKYENKLISKYETKNNPKTLMIK